MKISIIGSGNIATFLATRLFKGGHNIHQIISERVQRANELAQKVNAQVIVNLDALDHNIDALIVAIPDDDIKNLNIKTNCVVIHNSGTCSLDTISNISKNIGCIWPIYSITKNNLPTHNQIPLVINFSNSFSENIIRELCYSISESVTVLNDEQKQIAHLTATISNNFSNHLFTIAHDICIKNNISFQLLIPILELTIQKLNTSSPANNQTGPALRGDESTMKKHLEIINDDEKLKDLYKKMSELITQYHQQ